MMVIDLDIVNDSWLPSIVFSRPSPSLAKFNVQKLLLNDRQEEKTTGRPSLCSYVLIWALRPGRDEGEIGGIYDR